MVQPSTRPNKAFWEAIILVGILLLILLLSVLHLKGWLPGPGSKRPGEVEKQRKKEKEKKRKEEAEQGRNDGNDTTAPPTPSPPTPTPPPAQPPRGPDPPPPPPKDPRPPRDDGDDSEDDGDDGRPPGSRVHLNYGPGNAKVHLDIGDQDGRDINITHSEIRPDGTRVPLPPGNTVRERIVPPDPIQVRMNTPQGPHWGVYNARPLSAIPGAGVQGKDPWYRKIGEKEPMVIGVTEDGQPITIPPRVEVSEKDRILENTTQDAPLQPPTPLVGDQVISKSHR